MVNDVYDPLDEYVNVFKDRFDEVAKSTFAELASEANVDVETNRETCRQIYNTEDTIAQVKGRITKWTVFCALGWIAVVAAVVFLVQGIETSDARLWGGCGALIAILLWLLFAKIHPKLKALKQERDELDAICANLRNTAWQQMEPLNRLYDWDVFTRMMSRTVPRLEFDPFFTTQRLADLKAIYDWDDSFNTERSVLYSHSGVINGNPFVLCRTKKMEWGEKTYEGTLTIHWTESRRGSDGKYYTQHRSQVLRATVTAPYPLYFEKTRLIYGNTAAPDLTFTRRKSGLAAKEGSLKYKWKRGALRRKSRNLDDNDYAMMTNEDFEVAFDSSDRNNNQQFALLFTPLAQNSLMDLMKDSEHGYGDDFDFEKNHMINTIIPDHLQQMSLDMDPGQYRNFDFDKAAEDFSRINAEHFRAIYFAFAPLLCVPMYQQIRSQEDIYGRDMKRESTFWEHESLANFWGVDRFKAPDCVTDCIIKTARGTTRNGETEIKVAAYGYRVEQRLTYVRKFGGDGRTHSVPVYWDEYLPVTGQGEFYIHEDGDFNDQDIPHAQRIDHIRTMLSKTPRGLYRRHIASRLN